MTWQIRRGEGGIEAIKSNGGYVSIILTVGQIADLYKFVEPYLDEMEDGGMDVEITLLKAKNGGEGCVPDGIYAYVTEYPEEGSYGPLGEE